MGEYLLVEALVELVLDHLVDGVALELLLVVRIGRIEHLRDIGLLLRHLESLRSGHGLVFARASHL